MATLGQAYVQIMPSAKGISGSIQKVINPEATAAGKGAGTRIATSIAKSMGNIGKTMTKYITVPALGAATAVAGVVGALGFKRLVGMDTARAKLQGLGIEGKQLEVVMDNAKDAVTGTTHTMADGVDVAAGALAAGVKEGADLERYIKLVGDAATGANAPMGEMAQIFNRVQGTGKLTRHELNQIEHRLPGFSQAMAKNVGADSLEAFYDMVSAGKIGTDEFLDVMDDFAGGMSEAYAGTWSGLKDNVLANIGIIGEALLEGLFEDGKKGMAEFLDFLRNSDGLKEWATETGEKLRVAFNKIVEVIKDVIQWWSGLSDGAKKFIGVVAGIVIAIGPVLLIASKIITTIMKLTPLFKVLGAVIGAITSPIGLVVAAMIGAVALIYIYWEPIKEFFMNLWESVKDIWLSAVEFLSEIWEGISDFFIGIWEIITEIFMVVWEPIQEAWQEVIEFFTEIWMELVEFFTELWEDIKETMFEVWEPIQELWFEIVEVFTELWTGVLEFFSEIWNAIIEVVVQAWNVIIEFITPVLEFIRSVITSVWETILAVIKTVMDVIKNVIQTVWNIIKTVIQTVVNVIKTIIQTAWNIVKAVIQGVMSAIQGDISGVWNAIRSIIGSVMSGISSIISSIWNSILSIVSSITSGISSVVSSIFNGLRGIVSGAMGNVLGAISNGMSNALSTVTGYVSSFFSAGSNIVGAIADGIKGAIGKVTGAMSNLASKIREYLPFSPPKTGPLIDIMDVDWGGTIGGGIEKGEDAVAKAMDSILDFDLAKRATFNNPNSLNNDDVYASAKQSQPIILQVDGKTFARITGDYTSAEGGKRIRKIERGLA